MQRHGSKLNAVLAASNRSAPRQIAAPIADGQAARPWQPALVDTSATPARARAMAAAANGARPSPKQQPAAMASNPGHGFWLGWFGSLTCGRLPFLINLKINLVNSY